MATIGVYTLALIGFSIINAIIIKFVKSGNEVGMLDNFLGFFFGAARGALLISLGYFMLVIALPEKEYPDWLKQSYTRPYVEAGAIKLAQIAPNYLREISKLQKRATGDVEAAHDTKPDPEPQDPIEHVKSDNETGYSSTATNQLKRLIDGTQ